MAFRNNKSSAEAMFADARCAACRDGLDRDGRYCVKCLRSRRLKMFFATVVIGQAAAVGFYIMQSRAVSRIIPSDGPHTVPVASDAAKTGWYYFDVTDPLISDVSHHARIIADTPLAPKGAPASPGATSGTLDVAVSAHYGKSVILTFPSVPRACLANVCELHAIFDSDAPRTLAYDDISGQGATVFMLTRPADFLKRLPNAHDLTFIANMGTAVNTTITFGVQGFRLKVAALAKRIRSAQAVRPGARPDAQPDPG